MSHPTMAFERGWTDAERGRPYTNNPYHSSTGEWIAWRQGWNSLYAGIKDDEFHEAFPQFT